jgi:NADPH-dependent 2,4-dienoyl-CoA reductase/sulfur reductase-like enzyme
VDLLAAGPIRRCLNLNHAMTLLLSKIESNPEEILRDMGTPKTIVIGAGPVGALAALYAAQRNHEVEVYELRSGTHIFTDLPSPAFIQ